MDHLGARIARVDDVVDITARRGDVRVREALGVLGGELGALGDGIVGFEQACAVEDVDGGLGTDDGDLALRPREVHVGAQVLRAHRIVGAAVCLAEDHRHFRYRRLRVGVHELGTVDDDAAILLRQARQESWNVDEGQDRDVEGVAEAHEARGLAR